MFNRAPFMLLCYLRGKKEHGSCEIKDVDRWAGARTYYLHTYMARRIAG